MMIIEGFPYTSITSYRNVKREKKQFQYCGTYSFDSCPVRLNRKTTFFWIFLCFLFIYFFLYLLKLSVVAKNCFPWTFLMNCKWIIFSFLLNVSLSDHGKRAFLWRGHGRRIPTILTETLEPQCPYSTSIKQAYTRVALY